ncbi:MAG: enoyl-CoA hydratase/isomerase family protein [Lysinibacillus sp.]
MRNLAIEIADKIAYVKMTRSHNEWDTLFIQELIEAAQMLYDADDVQVVVVGSTGEHFSIGMPLEATVYESIADEYKTVQLATKAIKSWAKLPYPIIAAIQGDCSSFGFSLAAIADIRFVSPSARFSSPEARWGVVPAGGLTQRLPRIIGKGPAMAVLLGGEVLTAEQSVEVGLANQVVTDAWAEACRQAEKFSSYSPLALQYTKECILRGSELPFDQGLRQELDLYMVLQTSEDRMEGINAFIEKRAPIYKGE